LVNGQYATIALTDPFARGWFASDDRMHGVTTSFLSNHASVTVIWNLQAAGIVVGHVIAVLVAHHISLRRDPGRRAALLSQLPLAVLMVAYTLFGLWLLSTPAAG
jgi:NAD/NADP transhydrogenase beta subunit